MQKPTDQASSGPPTRIIWAAEAILVRHAPDQNGFCDGCRTEYARLTFHPCPQRRWAATVLRIPPDATASLAQR